MSIDRKIDTLIAAGWQVIERDFDEQSFANWRTKAIDCLTDLLGNDHVYRHSFETTVRKPDKLNVLAGRGILMAARETARWGAGGTRREGYAGGDPQCDTACEQPAPRRRSSCLTATETLPQMQPGHGTALVSLSGDGPDQNTTTDRDVRPGDQILARQCVRSYGCSDNK